MLPSCRSQPEQTARDDGVRTHLCHNGRWDKSKIGDTDATEVNRVARVYATYNEESEYTSIDNTEMPAISPSVPTVYDLMGRKVDSMAKGNVYIMGGKKIIK